MARRLALLRHAEAALAPGQAETDLFSVGDFPLSPRGRRQAESARDLLRGFAFDAAVASPALRARETAEIVAAPHGLPVVVEPDLREFPFAVPGGDYAAILAAIHNVGRALRDEEDPKLPGGGSFLGERSRFLAAVDSVLGRHERPLVVAHGITNRVFLASVLHVPPHALFRFAQDHACVNVVAYEGNRPVVTAVNWRASP